MEPLLMLRETKRTHADAEAHEHETFSKHDILRRMEEDRERVRRRRYRGSRQHVPFHNYVFLFSSFA
jgi:hypothetical protein